MANLMRKLFLGTALTGILSLTNCNEIDVTGDITIKEEGIGEITGKIVWDPDKDGYTEGVRANIGLGNWPMLNAPYETSSTSEGNFSFQEIPAGSYVIYVQKMPNDPYLYHYWRAKEGVTVTKQNVSNVGNIEIKEYSGPGYRLEQSKD